MKSLLDPEKEHLANLLLKRYAEADRASGVVAIRVLFVALLIGMLGLLFFFFH